MMDRHEFANGHLRVAVKADGAELCSLQDTAGPELLWQAAPVWPRHAPVLFPIVGRLKGDVLHHNGHEYRMTQHGFARDRRFAWLQRSTTSCRLALRDDPQTLAIYPFSFQLEIAYVLDGDSLKIEFAVTNTGQEVLPASIGAHPAFRWPLINGVAKETHTLLFAEEELAPIRRLSDGLLLPDPSPSPVRHRRLDLTPTLFDQDAVILDQLASRSVRYQAPRAPTVELSWEGFRQLGIWSRNGGDFLCIEPWHGFASPRDFDGEFVQKPGLMLIAPGEQRLLVHRINVC
jgi:galactose mutarotase-like enzyme